jgi:cysteine desulfurase/selenocysteine lyase
VPHIAIDVQALGADFLAFSSHKMCGPSGVGVLYGRAELLDVMTPMKTGGGMIHSVTKEKATWAGVPDRFEAGTPSLEGVIGLGAAVAYLQNIGMDVVSKYEDELTAYALERCRDQGILLIGPGSAHDRLAVFSFEVPGVHAHDVAELLNRAHVAIRAGHHCAQPLMQLLGLPGTARASFYVYNTKADIDAWLDAVASVARIMKGAN